jgi:hypothetical protein
MWPDNADDFARKKDDGRAEAALIEFWKEEYCVGGGAICYVSTSVASNHWF